MSFSLNDWVYFENKQWRLSSYSLSPLDNEETYGELRSRLHTEIAALKETLVLVDKDTTKVVDLINKNTRNVLDVLQRIIDKKQDNRLVCHTNTTDIQFPNPIHDLLSVGPLNRIEIPLDVIKLMITAGFDMNSMDNNKFSSATCLFRAIVYRQYNVVRFLVNQKAKCQESNRIEIHCGCAVNSDNPIVLLASHENVPLDLIDLLATPHDLTDNLCTAVRAMNANIALYLIKLGASVNKTDKRSRLPIHYFVGKYLWSTAGSTEFNTKLFMRLLPSRVQSVKILEYICEILTAACCHNHSAVVEVLYSLIQRLVLMQPMSVCFKVQFNLPRIYIDVCINDEKIRFYIFSNLGSPLGLDLFNLLLTELHLNVISAPNNLVPLVSGSGNEALIKYARAVDGLWRNYRHRCRVRSLHRLSILKTRSTMQSLDDYSFLTLGVPPHIRRLLAYRDVSERIFEEFCKRTHKSNRHNCESHSSNYSCRL